MQCAYFTRLGALYVKTGNNVYGSWLILKTYVILGHQSQTNLETGVKIVEQDLWRGYPNEPR